MSPDNADIQAIINGLTDLQKETEVKRLLDEALQEPISTEERLRFVEQILESFKGMGLLGRDEAGDLQLLKTVAQTYERFSHLDKAYESYEAALALSERLDDQSTRALVLCRMGRVLSRWGRWDEACAQLARSRRAFEGLEDRAGLARVALSLGIVRHEQADYAAAATAYGEAREHAEAAGSRKLAADAGNNLAVLATIRGDLDEAVRQYEACLAIFQELGDEMGQARTQHNLGMTHSDRHDWASAMDCFEKGFKQAQAQGQIDVMANIHLGTAEVLLELGGTTMALCYCSRALDIYRQVGDRMGEADTYRLLGKGFARNREWGKAESMLRHSLEINELCENPLGAAEALREIGRMHLARGKRQEARTSLEAALAAFRKLGAEGDAADVEGMINSL